MPRSVKKGPFLDDHLLKKVKHLNETNGKDRHQDLVAQIDHHSGDGGTHDFCAQRKEIYSRLHHREHGGTQTRRIFTDENLQRPYRQD